MIAVMNKNDPLQRLKQEIECIKQKLLDLGPIHPGSISGQYHVCGTASCRCHAPVNPIKHGPYNKLTYSYRGRSNCRFVRPECIDELRQRLDNYKTFRELTARWVELSIEMGKAEFFAKAEKAPAASPPTET